MESSTNLQQEHHQFQDYLTTVSSSLVSPSFSVADNDHAWRDNAPTFFLNNNNIHTTSGEESCPTSFNNSMIQELGFSMPNFHHDHQQLIPNKIKEESSTSSDHSDSSTLQKFSDMLSPSNTCPSDQMLLLNTLSPTYKNHMLQPSSFQPSMQFHVNSCNHELPSLQGSKGVTKFSRIFPSVNLSNLSSSSSSMDQLSNNNGLGGLGSLETARFVSGRGTNNELSSSSHLLELFKGTSHCGVDHGSQPSDDVKLCNISNNLSSLDNNGVLETKRPSYIVEPKSTQQTASSKKQRLESCASCPPFKVRKEKVGDRVAALQQLVAPYGKTDTASVLMEAIGYIQFLQNQVETLSVPYMKLASRTGSSNKNQRISNENGEIGEEKQDLRSRGLCVVPLSCMSYIASDPGINGGPWSHPHSFDHGF